MCAGVGAARMLHCPSPLRSHESPIRPVAANGRYEQARQMKSFARTRLFTHRHGADLNHGKHRADICGVVRHAPVAQPQVTDQHVPLPCERSGLATQRLGLVRRL
jgi:hypothetical protein